MNEISAVSTDPLQRLAEELQQLYSKPDAEACLQACIRLIRQYRALSPDLPHEKIALDQRDSLLIAYPEHVRDPHYSPLRSLDAALNKMMLQEFSSLHVLPFFASDGDFGFRVIDHQKIRRDLGEWDDIAQLADSYRLCVDLVCNHVSAASHWFKAYCDGNPDFRDFFIEYDPAFDDSQVIAAPSGQNFHTYRIGDREYLLWSRYGHGQLDLNYRQWHVLLAMLDNLLFLTRHGARWIRLDAIAYAWKQSGTTCAHQPQDMALVRVFRAVLDAAASDARLIAEIDFASAYAGYFPADNAGAQHAYDYSLPPLFCHALLSGDVSVLRRHLQMRPTSTAAWSPINLLATHDALFLKPMDPLFDTCVVDCLANATRANGGIVIERAWQGQPRPYECAIAVPALLSQRGIPDSLASDRIHLALSVLWALPGVPAVYLNTLLLAGNDHALLQSTDVARALNRATFSQAEFDAHLADNSLTTELLAHMRHLLRMRSIQTALQPHAAFDIIDAANGVLHFVRDSALHCIANFSHKEVCVALSNGWWQDALSGHLHREKIMLAPLQCAWLLHSNGPAWNLAPALTRQWHIAEDLTHTQKTRVWNDTGLPFVLDESYRRNHLPLVARGHADAIARDASSDYEHGCYRSPRISVVCFIPWQVLQRSSAFQEFEEAMRAAPFAQKIAWDTYRKRRDRLHATVCGQLQRFYDFAHIEYLAEEISKSPAFDVQIAGPWMGRSRNLGRLYLPLLPQADARGNPLSRIQALTHTEITGFYGLGLHQFADHLHADEADDLRGIMRKFGSRILAQTRVDSLALIVTHDDLILDSRILRHIPLRG